MIRSLTQSNGSVMRDVVRAIGIGTIAVALLDATDSVVFFGLTLHFNPVQVVQYIASSAFGQSAFDGGLATAFAGLVIHFGLAAAFTEIFARRVSDDSGGASIHGGERSRERCAHLALHEPAGAVA